MKPFMNLTESSFKMRLVSVLHKQMASKALLGIQEMAYNSLVKVGKSTRRKILSVLYIVFLSPISAVFYLDAGLKVKKLVYPDKR